MSPYRLGQGSANRPSPPALEPQSLRQGLEEEVAACPSPQRLGRTADCTAHPLPRPIPKAPAPRAATAATAPSV